MPERKDALRAQGCQVQLKVSADITKGESQVVSKLESQLQDCGFESHPMLDKNGVKAMPRLITTHNPGSLINGKRKKILGAKWGTPKKVKKMIS